MRAVFLTQSEVSIDAKLQKLLDLSVDGTVLEIQLYNTGAGEALQNIQEQSLVVERLLYSMKDAISL